MNVSDEALRLAALRVLKAYDGKSVPGFDRMTRGCHAMLVVEDGARDRRLARNALLEQDHLRFYAGVPVHSADGQPSGASCILDIKPRKFSKAGQRMLAVMGVPMSKEIVEYSSLAAA